MKAWSTFTLIEVSIINICNIPNRTLRRGRLRPVWSEMVRILARCSVGKIPMARPNEPALPRKLTNENRYQVLTQIQSKFSRYFSSYGDLYLVCLKDILQLLLQRQPLENVLSYLEVDTLRTSYYHTN